MEVKSNLRILSYVYFSIAALSTFLTAILLTFAYFSPTFFSPKQIMASVFLPINIFTSVDTAGDVGSHTSIVRGVDGLPVISYYDGTNGDLKIVKCGTSSCSSKNTITTVDAAGDVGWYTSIIIGEDGFPVISYFDKTNGNLKVAKCGNPSCSLGNIISSVDTEGAVGLHTSIVQGADGFPVISYFDKTNGNLKVAKCGNPSCSSDNSIEVIEPTGYYIGFYSSIILGADGLPTISYFNYQDEDHANLKVAKCGNPSCSSGNTINIIDATWPIGSLSNSIILGRDGFPVISYRNVSSGNLKVAKCDNPSCSSGVTTVVDSIPDVGSQNSITLGKDGYPVISYFDRTNINLKVAKCGNNNCTNGNIITTIDGCDNCSINGKVGQYNSIILGEDGLPTISYQDFTNGDLRVVKCGTASCNIVSILTPTLIPRL